MADEHTQESCRLRFHRLLSELHMAIHLIDRDTPVDNGSAPLWWKDMFLLDYKLCEMAEKHKVDLARLSWGSEDQQDG